MAAIVVEGLRKSYGSVTAVDGIDFEVAEGEVFAILGPNGAGKTTTVEILEGYRDRDGGRVEVLGIDPRHGGRRLRERIGVMLQETAVEPFLTVRESVGRTAGYYPRPRDPDEVIELVGLSEKSATRIKQLSGGQQRRLDLALGLVGNPELLFLDEPTTGFDPSARRGAWDLVRGLRQLGTTLLLTTHYMEEAQLLADRVAVIANGVLVAIGSPDVIGGRDLAKTLISFRLPDAVAIGDLPMPAAMRGAEVVVESAAPTRDLHTLTSWAVGRDIDLAGLTVARPSLEDVYLELTGSESGT